jgi:formylglycine-generating enzyme required for sulfatase activity
MIITKTKIMKRILLLLLGCTLILVTSAQSKKITIAVNDKVKIDMVLISPDTFIRKNYYGDTVCDYGRLCPVMGKRAYNGYDTIVLAPYYMAKFEVTQQLYATVMHKNPSRFNEDNNPYGSEKYPELLPVESVKWSEAQAFIDSLNKLTGKHFRLPTEAEWQYAAWGGHPRLRYSGSDTINVVAWDIHQGFTHNVGKKRPNGYGLYDMSGNANEWCSDWFSSDYYVPDSLYYRPTGPDSGELKVVKGGSCGSVTARALEVDTRVGVRSEQTSGWGIGFRLAMDAER